MKNVSDKSCRENQNTHSLSLPPPPETRTVYDITSKYMVEQERTQTIWRLRVAYWISKHAALVHLHPPTDKHTHTHTRTHKHTLAQARESAYAHKYVILTAFHSTWFRERACLVIPRILTLSVCVLPLPSQCDVTM
jgi:hypothetical protein